MFQWKLFLIRIPNHFNLAGNRPSDLEHCKIRFLLSAKKVQLFSETSTTYSNDLKKRDSLAPSPLNDDVDSCLSAETVDNI